MKKSLSIILAGLMVLSLTACGKKETEENKKKKEGKKISLFAETCEGDDVRISADFYYPEDADITIDDNEDHPNWIDIHYNSKNITISPSLLEDTVFDENKEHDKENNDTFKEFKINGYDCYGYEDFGGYWIYVYLEEVSDSTDRYLAIDTEIIDYSKDTPEGIAHYEDEDIKKIIHSFVYNGVIESSPEEE